MGCGGRLVHELEAHAIENQCEALDVTTASFKWDAIGFYEKLESVSERVRLRKTLPRISQDAWLRYESSHTERIVYACAAVRYEPCGGGEPLRQVPPHGRAPVQDVDLVAYTVLGLDSHDADAVIQ